MSPITQAPHNRISPRLRIGRGKRPPVNHPPLPADLRPARSAEMRSANMRKFTMYTLNEVASRRNGSVERLPVPPAVQQPMPQLEHAACCCTNIRTARVRGRSLQRCPVVTKRVGIQLFPSAREIVRNRIKRKTSTSCRAERSNDISRAELRNRLRPRALTLRPAAIPLPSCSAGHFGVVDESRLRLSFGLRKLFGWRIVDGDGGSAAIPPRRTV